MKKLLYVAVIISVLLVVSACSTTTTQPELANESAVATVVAATLSAIPPESPELTPTSMPPTVEPTVAFTPTPEPVRLSVVYNRAGEIWIWNKGGEPLKLSNSGIDVQPRISSDGQIVVFARNNELYAINADGSNLRKIVSKDYLNPYRPANYKWIWAEYYDWMLDTHILYFTTMAQLGDDGFPVYQFDLHRVNVDTGEVSRILAPEQGGFPYFSPNGHTLAVARPDSINVANVDGSNFRVALQFERVFTYSEWTFIPVLVPLPDGSGFRVIIPAHDPINSPDELTEFWEIPNVGENVLLHAYSQMGFPYRTLSPGGNSIAYSKRDANGTHSLCLYIHNLTQESCAPKSGLDVYSSNWAPDESKYNFQVLNRIGVEPDYVYETTYYVSSAMEPNSLPVEINQYVWLAWVDSDQYLYISEDWDLMLATYNGSSTRIHNGVKNPASRDGILPFDFTGK